MKNIYGYEYNDLEEKLLSIGEKKYKTKQLFEWLYIHKVSGFDEMTNLSKESINNMKKHFSIELLEIVKVQKSEYTSKYLFGLDDGNFIEAVLMKHDYGNSICVSSQVGCNMSCSFCESGLLPKVRNLEVFEMVEQVLLIEKESKERIDSVVIMGIGEPFDNYDNVMRFTKIINDPFGLKIGARHITISTCGIIPGIEKFMKEGLQVNLAISLHAPNDPLRSSIMKINDVYKIGPLLNTIKEYIKQTNRRVTIEYVMLRHINDSEDNANDLADLLHGMNVYVNLIPYNETSAINYNKSSKERIDKFYKTLIKRKINVTVRREFGSSIDAACGQLRAKEGE